MDAITAKKQIVKYAKILDKKGLVNSLEGNISILDRENGYMYITPTATRKGTLTENCVAVLKVSDKETWEQVDGDIKRSSEYLLHKAALEAAPDAMACVHTHAPFISAYAYANQDIDLKCSTTLAGFHEGKIPCIPYGEPGTPEIAAGLKEHLQAGKSMVLLGNHGMVCVGKDMEAACALLEATEAALEVVYYARQLGLSDIPEEKFNHFIERLRKDKGKK